MNIKLVTSQAAKRAARGFTLIEMIGVLAVIAILAAVLIPKVFEAINNAKVNNAAMSVNSVKTAIMDHYAKYGSLIASNGTTVSVPIPCENYDQTLLIEGFMDKPFSTKIGDGVVGPANARVRLFNITSAGTNTVDGTDTTAFNLGGVGTVGDMPGSACVEAVITGVTQNDAKDLNDRLDGPTLGAAIGADDFKGRVKYVGTTPTTTVYVYLTHR